MKLKKIISVIAALAISSCFAISANAATEDQKLTVNPVISVDEYGYYIVNYKLSYNGSLTLETKGSGNRATYSGRGIYVYEFSINNITAADYSADFSSSFQECTINLDGTTLKMGGNTSGTVGKLWSAEPGENIILASIYTNYTTANKTHNEIYNIFKNVGKTTIKVATISGENVYGTTKVTDDNITTYGINEDGKTKHVDAVYKLNVATLANISGNTVSFDNEETSSIEDGKQLVVLYQNLDGATLDKDNKIAISYNGEERESAKTIFELLGIEGDGTATGRTINVNVKTAGTNSADGFSFDIK